MPAPDVSVVVPAHDRPALLARTLAALGRQTLPAARFEVVVVDDGSAPALTPAAAGLALRVVRHERARGPAAARNTGWRAARGALVAFTDDDCEPEPGWLAALLDAAGDDGDVIVQGPVRPPGDQRAARRPLSHAIEVEGPSRLCVSANIAYGRALLERVGGFDETFHRACGEDVELGARALKAGGEIRFAADATVLHEVRQPTLSQLVAYTWRWTDAVRAVSMHPELRDLLLARVFWKPSHPRLLLALAGLGTRRPALALAAALPYLAFYRRLYRGAPSELARELPRHLVVDACEIGTAAAGSVRHRTLML